MITLTSVTKKFKNFTAVDDVTYSIDEGECFALLGPNGAGKTTIVRMLLGFTQPTSGTVTINGIPASDPESRRNSGYLAELLRIPPYLSGFEYLMRHAALRGFSRTQAVPAVETALETVSMKGFEKKKSATYSKGMKQRIGLAAAILGTPKLLILDEPVSGLDPIGIRDVRRILETMRAGGATIVLNSHLLSEVEKTCTTAGIMYGGKVLVKDSISAIVREGETLEDVFIRYVEKGRSGEVEKR
jgi:ABC-2 type transport system ATP-binding protein